MEGEYVVRSGVDEMARRLEAASEHLGTVLESADIERDRRFAEAVVAALAATDRAYELHIAGEEDSGSVRERRPVDER